MIANFVQTMGLSVPADKNDTKSRLNFDESFNEMVAHSGDALKPSNFDSEVLYEAAQKGNRLIDCASKDKTVGKVVDAATTQSDRSDANKLIESMFLTGSQMNCVGAQIHFSVVHAPHTISHLSAQKHVGPAPKQILVSSSVALTEILSTASPISFDYPKNGRFPGSVFALSMSTNQKQSPLGCDIAAGDRFLGKEELGTILLPNGVFAGNGNSLLSAIKDDSLNINEPLFSSQLNESLASTIIHLSREATTGEIKNLRLKLHPAELGQLTIRIQRQGENLNITVQAQTMTGLEKVLASKDDILRSLELEGGGIANVTIHMIPEQIDESFAYDDGPISQVTSNDGQKHQHGDEQPNRSDISHKTVDVEREHSLDLLVSSDGTYI